MKRRIFLCFNMTFISKLVFLISILNFCEVSNGIRCYQCGSEAISLDYDISNSPSPAQKEHLENVAIALESCFNMDSSFSSWSPYSVDCGPGEVCTKTVIDDGEDSYGRHRGYLTASRGCSMRNTSYGNVHYLGCGILKSYFVPPVDNTPKRWDLVCFCDTDYCNRSISISASSVSIISAVITLLYFLSRDL